MSHKPNFRWQATREIAGSRGHELHNPLLLLLPLLATSTAVSGTHAKLLRMKETMHDTQVVHLPPTQRIGTIWTLVVLRGSLLKSNGESKRTAATAKHVFLCDHLRRDSEETEM